MAYFKHENAIVESSSIGDGTTIRAFAHVLPGARIGRDCEICDHTFIENDVSIGDRTTIQCGVQIWDGVTIEADVFVGPNATFTNDRFPRSRQGPSGYRRTLVKTGASIGANATILPGVTIGAHANIAAGTVLTMDAPSYAILEGNPARIVGYEGALRPAPLVSAPAAVGSEATAVEGVNLHRLPLVEDLRGTLTFAEFERHIPFTVKRCFLVFGVSSEQVRGEHAHKTLHQFLVCVHGRCNVVADDGVNRQEFALDSPAVGIHIPPGVWAVQYKHSPDAVLMALVSDFYDSSDYIRDYGEFLAAKRGTAPIK